MNVFLARQPIFDDEMKVFAYELLYRSSEENSANVSDGDSATGDVIINSLILMGLDKITGNKKAFINFTKQTINSELPQLFSSKDLVVEILEDVIPDEEFMERCKGLKREGYKLALDDFVLDYKYENIVKIVDIIKVDFMLTTRGERAKIIYKYKNKNISFLAEKIETKEEYFEAIEMGYKYFQGYFFSRPIILTGNDVKTFTSTYSLVLQELSLSDPEYSNLEKIIERDMAMSYKLLRLINSAVFYSRNEITSLRHALTMLGFREIKKWVSLLMIRDLGRDQPHELIRISLIRAKMCELLYICSGSGKRCSEAFLMGLFSLIDVILNRRLDEVVDELPLARDIKDALLGDTNIFSKILDVTIFYERCEWNGFMEKAEEIGLSNDQVIKAYFESIEWMDSVDRAL